MSSSKDLKLKYRMFAKEYINNSFNASLAYAKVYNIVIDKDNTNSVRACASRLLTNANFIKVYCDELEKLDLDINEAFIVQEALQLAKNAKKEGDKLRALELISKIKGFAKPDQQQSISIYNDLESKTADMLDKRRGQIV